MWDGFVSIVMMVLDRVLFRFTEMFWQHPVVGALFMTGFLGLSIMLWVEIVTGGTSEPRLRTEDIKPIRLR